MIAEKSVELILKIQPGSRLRLIFLPGVGHSRRLPKAVIDALGHLFDLKIKNRGIEIEPFDFTTLHAIRTHGYYSSDEDRVVEVEILDGFDEAQFEQISAGLEEVQLLS